jgi:cilia- and flagella-associated protein 57
LQFNADESMLLTLSGFPDWTVLCWDWAKAKVVASLTINNPVLHCQFNPVDIAMISIASKEHIKFYRINDKDLREMDCAAYPKNGSFLSSCWLRTPDDTFLAGTDTGNIYIFQHGEFNSIVDRSPGANVPITALVPVLGGFFVGSKGGEIHYYQYNESHDRGLNGQFAPLIRLEHDLCNGK